MKTRFVASFFGLAYVLCAGIAYAQKDTVLDRFPFEVSVTLSVQGLPVEIRRVLECRMRIRLHPGEATSPDYGLRPREIWSPNVRNFYQALPSGQVIVVFTPDVCDLYSKRLKPLPADYIPTIFWLNAPDDFTVFEAYISPRYYESPNARMRFHSISVRNAPDGANVDDDDRYGALRLSGGDGHRRFFVSYLAQVISESIWSERPRLAERLRRLNGTTQITDKEILKELGFLPWLPLTFTNEGEQYGVNVPSRGATTLSPLIAPLLVPLRQEGNKWKLSGNEHSVLRYFLDEESKTRPRSMLYEWSINVEINNKEFSRDSAAGIAFVIYDADQGMLIRILRELLRL